MIPKECQAIQSGGSQYEPVFREKTRKRAELAESKIEWKIGVVMSLNVTTFAKSHTLRA